MHLYHVYIMTNLLDTVLYIGVTNNLARRIEEHRQKKFGGFTAKYNVTKLVYFEETSDIMTAIEREKIFKGWRRSKKDDLIRQMNPEWKDLSLDW